MGLTAHAGSRRMPVLALMESVSFYRRGGIMLERMHPVEWIIIESDGMGMCVRSALGRGSDG